MIEKITTQKRQIKIVNNHLFAKKIVLLKLVKNFIIKIFSYLTINNFIVINFCFISVFIKT